MWMHYSIHGKATLFKLQGVSVIRYFFFIFTVLSRCSFFFYISLVIVNTILILINTSSVINIPTLFLNGKKIVRWHPDCVMDTKFLIFGQILF